jgi:hypothetical protein
MCNTFEVKNWETLHFREFNQYEPQAGLARGCQESRHCPAGGVYPACPKGWVIASTSSCPVCLARNLLYFALLGIYCILIIELGIWPLRACPNFIRPFFDSFFWPTVRLCWGIATSTSFALFPTQLVILYHNVSIHITPILYRVFFNVPPSPPT